jgi:hypothetical protein
MLAVGALFPGTSSATTARQPSPLTNGSAPFGTDRRWASSCRARSIQLRSVLTCRLLRAAPHRFLFVLSCRWQMGVWAQVPLWTRNMGRWRRVSQATCHSPCKEIACLRVLKARQECCCCSQANGIVAGQDFPFRDRPKRTFYDSILVLLHSIFECMSTN